MKTFIQTLICILIFLQTIACTKQSASIKPADAKAPENIQPQDQEKEGGISAGGGGTLPANPIPLYRVVEILGEAKQQLRLYLRYETSYRYTYVTPFEEKYFYADDNLLTVLERTDIEILEDRHCKDKWGNNVDASVHASRPNTICFSAYSVAPKLIEENANKEILALLIHELAHLLGATEKEAVELQSSAAFGLQRADSENLFNKTQMITMEMESYNSTMLDLSVENIKADISAANAKIEKILTGLYEYESQLKNNPFKFSNYQIKNYESLMIRKLWLVNMFLTTLVPSNPASDYYKERYEKAFDGKEAVTYAEMEKNLFETDDLENIYKNELIQKFHTVEDLKETLNDLKYFTENLSSQIRAISFNQPLPFFRLPTNRNKVNPWTHFIGAYKASKGFCQSSDATDPAKQRKLTEIEVHFNTINYPVKDQQAIYVQMKYDSLTMDQPFYNGAGQGGATFVQGDETIAVKTSERGTRWYDRQGHGWNKSTMTIYREPTRLMLKEKHEFFRLDHRDLYRSENECTYELTPQ